MTFLFHTNCFSWPQFIIKKTLFLFTFLNFISTFIFLSLPPYLSLSLPLSPSLSPSLSLSLSLSLSFFLSLSISLTLPLSLSLSFFPLSLSHSLPLPLSLSLSLSVCPLYWGILQIYSIEIGISKSRHIIMRENGITAPHVHLCSV